MLASRTSTTDGDVISGKKEATTGDRFFVRPIQSIQNMRADQQAGCARCAAAPYVEACSTSSRSSSTCNSRRYEVCDTQRHHWQHAAVATRQALGDVDRSGGARLPDARLSHAGEMQRPSHSVDPVPPVLTERGPYLQRRLALGVYLV